MEVRTIGRWVLAIDQGTSATKAVLVDSSGRITRRVTVPVGQTFPRPGWCEQDADEIWRSVQKAVAEVLADVDPAQVACVGLSTQRESTLLWERSSGRALSPLLGWQDTRGASRCAALRAAGHGDRIRSITGLPVDAMFSASKAAALLDEQDPDRSRSRRGELCLGTVDSWLLHKLGGEHLIEVGNASRTQLLDIESRAWDQWLLDLYDIPVEALPRVVPSVGPFVDAAGLAPLPPTTPVTGVLGDSHAALFAHAGWRSGRVKATYGTGSSVMGVIASGGTGTSGVARTIGWEINAPAYALEGNIRSSGATLVWLARLFDTTPAQIAQSAAPDSGGVTLVPAFSGLAAPWWDEQVRALICGMSESTTRAHLARAALESIGHQVEDVIAAVEAAGGTVEVILADGGPSANSALMQVQADLSGRAVATSQMAELSALGAAHLAGHGAGLWTLSDLDALPHDRTVYEPLLDRAECASRRRSWHRAVDAARILPKGMV